MHLAADGETATSGADYTTRPKLLIVDDDPEVRVVVAEFLESSGYNVVQANGGLEALELLPRHPDLRMIISDIRMPDMSGIDLVDLATQCQRDLKVILISGYFVPQQIGWRFLSQPFRMRELEAVVRAELGV